MIEVFAVDFTETLLSYLLANNSFNFRSYSANCSKGDFYSSLYYGIQCNLLDAF